MVAPETTSPAGQHLAITAQSLFLGNLLIAPGLCFAILAWLWWKRRDAPPLARQHLDQTLTASLWAGALLVLANLAILLLGGYDAAHTWVILILYFTCAHSTLILLGMLGLSRALAGQLFTFPVIGRWPLRRPV